MVPPERIVLLMPFGRNKYDDFRAQRQQQEAARHRAHVRL
jgi:hypothetical protein